MKTKHPSIILAIIFLSFIACQFSAQPSVSSNETPSQTQEIISQPTASLIPTITAQPIPSLDSNSAEIYNADMVFVPAGELVMGTDTIVNFGDETPAHTVDLDAFYIDKYEVTNANYKICVEANACQPPTDIRSYSRDLYYGNPEYENYPVVYIEWEMANTYCTWRGGRLPTEAEWEKAARGTDGRIFPWGDVSSCDFANYNASNCVGDTTAVGSYEKGISPYGVYDMAGNVDEWVSDWYQKDYYSTVGESISNPQGPPEGDRKINRGGTWRYYDAGIFSFNRQSSIFGDEHGIRCARNANP